MEKYEQISVVGEGSYGLVMKCKHKETDQIVAVKKFLETEEDATIRKMALREIRMLKRLKHENLVAMIEVFRHRKRFYLVFEYLEGTVLDELEKMPGGLGDERSRERIFQVIRAISYCHSNHIIHRDVKPENVLVSSLGVVKLCDFGFARIVSINGEACTEYVATRWYRAPELLVGEPVYGPPVDVWAIGCLFAEMMTGDPMFPGDSDIDQLYLIVKMLGKPCIRHQQLMSKNTQLRGMIKSPNEESAGLYKNFPSWSLQAVDFLAGCMKMDPQQRLTSDELLKHTYFMHDKFPQRFLPALREKVNIEFNNPLLRRFKTEILMSTDKKDESRSSRKSTSNNRFCFTTEGGVKRKLSCDNTAIGSENFADKNLITLAKTSQRLNVIQKNNVLHKQTSLQVNRDSNHNKLSSKQHQLLSTPKIPLNTEMHMLEKSLETLVKIKTNVDDERPRSVHKHGGEITSSPILPDSPPGFQSLHYANVNFGDYGSSTNHNKSPNFLHHHVLHPSINNISFSVNNILNKDGSGGGTVLPKRSPNILQNATCQTHHNIQSQSQRVPSLLGGVSSSNRSNQFLKKLDRNVVVENIFSNGDQVNISMNNAPVWLNSFASSMYNRKNIKQECGSNKMVGNTRNDDFCLPDLPGATGSPNKPKKKSLPEVDVTHSNEVTPRIKSASSHQNSSS